MDEHMRFFDDALEKLRSGFAFDTVAVRGLCLDALARAEAAEAAVVELDAVNAGAVEVIGFYQRRENDALGRAEAAEARVAELEAALAAERAANAWRRVTETPAATGYYQVVVARAKGPESDHAIWRINWGWAISDVLYWRPIPPLPPQEPPQ